MNNLSILPVNTGDNFIIDDPVERLVRDDVEMPFLAQN